MIVDIHTHIFPPDFVSVRARLVEREPAFAEMYADARARMATADDLLTSMAEAKVDVSVACGFWWDDAALARDHAAYLVEVAAASRGRILAFVPLAEGVEGASGIGEVRVADPALVPRTGLPALVHCSEEVGHTYPGKAGGLSPGGVWQALREQPEARLIAAHLGAGMPFFALMPEVRELLETDRLIFDTAATAFLYRRDAGAEGAPSVHQSLVDLAGTRHLAWGSDFPLRSQAIDRAEVEAGLPSAAAREPVLGGNAARFLGLSAG